MDLFKNTVVFLFNMMWDISAGRLFLCSITIIYAETVVTMCKGSYSDLVE